MITMVEHDISDFAPVLNQVATTSHVCCGDHNCFIIIYRLMSITHALREEAGCPPSLQYIFFRLYIQCICIRVIFMGQIHGGPDPPPLLRSISNTNCVVGPPSLFEENSALDSPSKFLDLPLPGQALQ